MNIDSPTPLPRILVADDDAALGRLLVRALEAHGFQAHVVLDGTAALDWLANELPDAILLDITMPGLDGRDVLTRIRRDPRLSGVPVVMLTGRDDEYTRDDVLALGARDLIGKPASPEAVVRKLRRVLGL